MGKDPVGLAGAPCKISPGKSNLQKTAYYINLL